MPVPHEVTDQVEADLWKTSDPRLEEQAIIMGSSPGGLYMLLGLIFSASYDIMVFTCVSIPVKGFCLAVLHLSPAESSHHGVYMQDSGMLTFQTGAFRHQESPIRQRTKRWPGMRRRTSRSRQRSDKAFQHKSKIQEMVHSRE